MNFKCTTLVLLTVVPLTLAVGIPGAPRPIKASLTDPNVIFAVNAINDYYNTLGDRRPRTAFKVIGATSQVVSGMLYRYTIEVHLGSDTEVCRVGVWSRLWLAENEATQLQGTPSCVLISS